MQNLKLLLGVIGGTLLLVFGVAFLFSSGETDSTEPTIADAALTEADRRHVKSATDETEDNIEAEDSAEAETEEDALEDSESTDSAETESNDTITIVEFSDFQCPACKASAPVISRVVADNPGRVELVYRHFPLESIHPNAKPAAIASEIVGEQGLFWEYHDVLFDNQDDWGTESDPTELFITYAEEVGADVTDFEVKMKEDTYIDPVEADIRDGFSLGVNSTPTIYVNGEKLENASALQAAVEARL